MVDSTVIPTAKVPTTATTWNPQNRSTEKSFQAGIFIFSGFCDTGCTVFKLAPLRQRKRKTISEWTETLWLNQDVWRHQSNNYCSPSNPSTKISEWIRCVSQNVIKFMITQQYRSTFDEIQKSRDDKSTPTLSIPVGYLQQLVFLNQLNLSASPIQQSITSLQNTT